MQQSHLGWEKIITPFNVFIRLYLYMKNQNCRSHGKKLFLNSNDLTSKKFDANLCSRSRNLNRLSLHISFHRESPPLSYIFSYSILLPIAALAFSLWLVAYFPIANTLASIPPSNKIDFQFNFLKTMYNSSCFSMRVQI